MEHKQTAKDEWVEQHYKVLHTPTGYWMSRHPGSPEPVFAARLHDEKGYKLDDLVRMGVHLLREQWQRDRTS